jgi:hypothetical protein
VLDRLEQLDERMITVPDALNRLIKLDVTKMRDWERKEMQIRRAELRVQSASPLQAKTSME